MAEARVLIIDDDPAILRLCRRVLERAKFDVKTSTSPRDGLSMLVEERFDVVIADTRMPGMDGFEVAVRVGQIQPDAAVILMTGYGAVETAIQVLRRGVDGLLVKPFESSSELVETVRQVLKARKFRQDAARLKVLRPLFDISERLFTQPDLERVVSFLIETATELFRVDYAGIYRKKEKQDSWYRLGGADLEALAHPVAINLRQFFEHNSGEQTLVVHNHHMPDGEFKQWLDENDWYGIFVPVAQPDSQYVFYGLRNPEIPGLERADIEMTAILARQAVLAIEKADIYEDLIQTIERVERSQKALLLAEKMAALGRLMASLAHEVNNPLQSVRNCLYLAGREDVSPTKSQEYLNMAVNEIDRLTVLTQNTLDFSNPGQVERRKVLLIPVMENVLNLLAPQLKQAGVEVMRQFPDEPVELEMIQDHIQQVFLNLILNGVDAARANSKPGKIWIDVYSKAEKVEIYIEDSGEGLTPGLEGQIFEPFFSTRPDGHGLGLTISYELIVDVHQGEMQFVAPRYGGGARIGITLPK